MKPVQTTRGKQYAAVKPNHKLRWYNKATLLYHPFLLLYHYYDEIAEMYSECVIASWDALIPVLDKKNIERRVQLDAEKKSNVYANYKLQEKTASHDMQICNSWKQFLSTGWLFTVYFALSFQTKAEKCFLTTFLSR